MLESGAHLKQVLNLRRPSSLFDEVEDDEDFGNDRDSVISENETEIHDYLADNVTKFLLSNARSLAPKITSLFDYMYELQCDFTWMPSSVI